MQGFFPIASGSKGNALLLISRETTLLIDAGVSVKRVQKALVSLGKSLEDIEGVLITHEHHDHISSVRTLNEKYGIPIFCNIATARGIYERLAFVPKCKIFSTGELFSYKDILVDPFSIAHDTLDPVAFKMEICDPKITIAVCTDLGFAPSLVEHKLRFCDMLYVEANHDPGLVQQSKRPNVYKTRVLGNQGHLSNESCAALLNAVYHRGLRHIYLAHLSSECNTKQLAMKTVQKVTDTWDTDVTISIAHQEEMSEPFFFTPSTKIKTNFASSLF